MKARARGASAFHCTMHEYPNIARGIGKPPWTRVENSHNLGLFILNLLGGLRTVIQRLGAFMKLDLLSIPTFYVACLHNPSSKIHCLKRLCQMFIVHAYWETSLFISRRTYCGNWSIPSKLSKILSFEKSTDPRVQYTYSHTTCTIF